MTEPITPERLAEEDETPDAPEGDDDATANDDAKEDAATPAPPDESPPEARGPSPEEMETKFKKLAASATTWRNRITAVLEEDAQHLVPCELCEPDIPGFHWPAGVEQPRDELHARLLDVLRTPTAPEYRDAAHVRRCSECDGYGKVVSGSRVELNRLVQCVACIGKGYLGDASPSPNGAAESVPVAVPVIAGDAPAAHDDADLWGSPRLLGDGQENPNFGKMPQYKNPSLP